MIVVARRWRRPAPTAPVAEPAGEREAAWRERLEAELKRFDA